MDEAAAAVVAWLWELAFTSREHDTETGLIYYRARYYDPTHGRFLSEDPIGFSGGANFYAYVGGNSVRFVDPSGNELGTYPMGNGQTYYLYDLNKVGGLSYGKTAAVIEQMAGLRLARSTYCRALLRLGHRAEPTYRHLVKSIRASPVVYPDETGWRIGGGGLGCGRL